jgi:SAM-dependent methyltransferase
MSYGHDNFTLKNVMKFNKSMSFDEDIENILMSKINQVIGLDMPVLELFPGNGQFTSKLISAEPLYIADYFQETLDEVGSGFNEFYDNRRLMKLKISDFQLPLPNDQMGLVISFKFFFVKDLAFVTDLAREVFRILKSGGIFIFNFIPDNTSQGIRIVEQKPLAMINFQQLIRALEEIGYEISNFDIQNNYGSSITARKPGDLSNIKISSSLARIIDKSEPLV